MQKPTAAKTNLKNLTVSKSIAMASLPFIFQANTVIITIPPRAAAMTV
jgi:hypothetical protein